MKLFFSVFSFFFTTILIAQVDNQNVSIDEKMKSIPLKFTTSTTSIASFIDVNFKTDNEKIRATFFWIANTISYDVANRNEPNGVYTSQEKIDYALKNKKGVCINYAEVYNAIANELGIETVIVLGYTKQNNKVNDIPHAWNASKIDGKWYVFDVTWAAGYVNGTTFYKKLNNSFYKVAPSKMIATHMPFDYLWQFSQEPITNNEFFSGIVEVKKAKQNFDFTTEIEKYKTLLPENKAFETSKRVEKNGVINKFIADYLQNQQQEFLALTQNKNVEKYNELIADYNQGVSLLNDFILYRNKKFKPTFSDEILLEMITIPYQKLIDSQKNLNNIGSMGRENQSNINKFRNEMQQNIDKAKMHFEFVTTYLTKNTLQRKMMFVKVK